MDVALNKKKSENMGGKTERSSKKRKEKETVASPASSPESNRSGSASPEPNCAICLGNLQNKSFTDSCFHMFCFTCLLEWSKVKAVCPLCKQAFKSIIHNVRSNQDYDQYHLRPQDTGSPEGGRFRYRTTLTTERWMFRQQMETQRQLQMLQRPTAQTTRTHWRRYRQAATSSFRHRIYNQNMWVSDLSHPPERPPRYRNISVNFFRRNPAATHRLVPWLNRELNVLLHNREDHVQFLLELIMDLIKRFEIQGEEFLEHIRSFLGDRSEHFVHEFYNFARSPFDMVAYDNHAIYNEPEPHVHSIESDSSSDNDDVILVSTTDGSNVGQEQSSNPEPPNTNTRSNDISPLLMRVRDFLAFIDNGQAEGWDSPLPGPSSLRWSPVTSPRSGIAEQGQPGNSLGNAQNSITVDASPTASPSHNYQSDEDDVLIVGFEKAWDRRTPIQLSSGDESTSRTQSLEKRKKKREKSHRKRDRSQSREARDRYSSQLRSNSQERTQQRDSSPEIIAESSSSRQARHFRFTSDSPFNSRHSRSPGSDRFSTSRGHSSHSSDHKHRSRRRSRSPYYRRERHSPIRSTNQHRRYSSDDESVRYRSRSRSTHFSRSKTRECSVESKYSRTSKESKKRHRRWSSTSVETVYEKSTHKSHKQKKHKRKKHKSKDKKRSRRDGISSSVEVLEISEDENLNGNMAKNINDNGDGEEKSERNREEDGKHWKKHPTGHKKSRKSRAENLHKQNDSSNEMADNEASSAACSNASSSEKSSNGASSSSYDQSKWRAIGEDTNAHSHQGAETQSSECDNHSLQSYNENSCSPARNEGISVYRNEVNPSPNKTENPVSDPTASNLNNSLETPTNSGIELTENENVCGASSQDSQKESLDDIEKTLRANIINRLSHSKSSFSDPQSSVS